MRMRITNRSGFTLVELMVAMVLSTLVVGSMLYTFQVNQRGFTAQKQRNGLVQSARTALDVISNDVRMAGYGMPVPDNQVANWVTWVSGVTGALTVKNGPLGAPDELLVVTARAGARSTLYYPVVSGSTNLQVAAGTGVSFDNQDHPALVWIGGHELARVISVSGDVLTISTDPASSGVGLTQNYLLGAPVEIVQVVRYYCELSPSVSSLLVEPYLGRQVVTNSAQVESHFDVVCAGIENLQFTQSSDLLLAEVTGRAARQDMTYVHPTEGDAYRRQTLRTTLTRRN